MALWYCDYNYTKFNLHQLFFRNFNNNDFIVSDINYTPSLIYKDENTKIDVDSKILSLINKINVISELNIRLKNDNVYCQRYFRLFIDVYLDIISNYYEINNYLGFYQNATHKNNYNLFNDEILNIFEGKDIK